jgi:type IV pilus assembly protein PilB
MRCCFSAQRFEPGMEEFRIRFRIDGVLVEYARRPMVDYSSILNGVKVLSDLDIATHHIPQDGHIELVLEQTGQENVTGGSLYFDIRVSVFPSVNGEVVVMRVLNRANALLSVSDLGMDAEVLKQLRTILLTQHGMILVTGPTGSGKTTTLYSVLAELKSSERNIITLEDPIEFHLDWLRQCEINEARGFTYEMALASVLRQDPDVLMVATSALLSTRYVAHS